MNDITTLHYNSPHDDGVIVCFPLGTSESTACYGVVVIVRIIILGCRSL